MPRPRIHDEHAREHLLELAAEEITARGVPALTLRNLARTAETTTTAVYSLFGNKAGLLQAVFDKAFERFGFHLDGIEQTTDPWEDLVRLGHAYRGSALADPYFYPVMFGPVISADDLSRESQQRAAATFEPLRQAVERAVAAGMVRNEEPGDIATALWAAVHGLVSLELADYFGGHIGDRAAFFDASLRATLTGWS